jgi:hypothetical protein
MVRTIGILVTKPIFFAAACAFLLTYIAHQIAPALKRQFTSCDGTNARLNAR